MDFIHILMSHAPNTFIIALMEWLIFTLVFFFFKFYFFLTNFKYQNEIRIVPLLVPSFTMLSALVNFLETFPAARTTLGSRKWPRSRYQ